MWPGFIFSDLDMIEILSVKAWALETRFFNRMAPIVLHRIGAGKDLGPLIQEDSFKPAAYSDFDPSKVYQVNPNLFWSGNDGYFFQDGEENIIPFNRLKGVVTKDRQPCGPAGTSAMADKMKMDDLKKNVSAHFIQIDSPGGAVDGTPEFASVVANLTKPVVAFVDGMAASAAYWIASQTDHIVTNQLNYTEVGSIGTLAVLANEKEYLKKQGLKVEIMRATQSVDKARLNSIEDWPKESLKQMQLELDQINADFIQSVNTGRNGKLFTMGEDIFTGKMYDQRRALSLGMVDDIGTLEDAITQARTLAQKTKTTDKS